MPTPSKCQTEKLLFPFMSESPLQRLPLGTVDFRQLRLMNQVYVDKTSLIYKLTSNTGFYFFGASQAIWEDIAVEDDSNAFYFRRERV